MDGNHITVIYKWTAKPEKLGELTAIYENVTDAMGKNEPGDRRALIARIAVLDTRRPSTRL